MSDWLPLALLLFLLPTAAAANDVAGAVFAAENCGFCHGADGNSAMARFPSLAGLTADYILKQLRDFRSGRRANDDGLMASILQPFGGADLAAAAQYYAGQIPRARTAPATAATPGARLYRDGRPGSRAMKLDACASCHEDGADMPYDVVDLRAQPGSYLEKQLREFRSGRRRNDPGAVMQKIAIRLSAAEIAALSQFLADGAAPAARESVR